MLNTVLMLIIVCVLATVLLLDFAILIPKFGAEHFGLPEDLTKMMMKMPDRPLWVNILGLFIMLAGFAGAVGVLVWAGFDAVKTDMSFVQIFLRFLIILDGYKLYDIICFDWLFLTKWKIPQKIYPQTAGAKGYDSFGFNTKSQIIKLFVFAGISLLAAAIISRF